jgi:hypothetical protein
LKSVTSKNNQQKTMKTKLTLTLTMLALISSAQTLKFNQTNGWITLSLNDSNHLYQVQQSTNLTKGFVSLTNIVGGPNLTALFRETNKAAFYCAKQLDGFLIYATPIVSGGGGPGACTGPYIGYATYPIQNQPYWIMATNAPSYIASDGTGRTDTHIYAASISGDYACGQTPITIPYQYDPDGKFPFIFVIYFSNKPPTGPYPIRLQGFLP